MSKTLFNLFPVLFIFVFSSCSTTYYYGRVSSVDAGLVQGEAGQFVSENDMVDIVYSFQGEDLYLNMAVINNLVCPVVFVRQASLLVTEKKSVDFTISEWEVTDLTEEGGWLEEEGASDNGLLIPPQSYMNCRMFVGNSFPFEKYPDKDYISRSMYKKNTRETTVKVMDFLPENTPFYFGTYLNFYALDENGNRHDSLVTTQTFFLSEVTKVKSISPKNMSPDYQDRGDLFYLTRESQAGSIFLGSLALGGIILYEIATLGEDE